MGGGGGAALLNYTFPTIYKASDALPKPIIITLAFLPNLYASYVDNPIISIFCASYVDNPIISMTFKFHIL